MSKLPLPKGDVTLTRHEKSTKLVRALRAGAKLAPARSAILFNYPVIIDELSMHLTREE